MKNINLTPVSRFIRKRKYAITIVVFIAWILIFDQNSVVNQLDDVKEIKTLENSKIMYRKKITTDSILLYQLKTDKKNLEKFAREQFLMKKKNEEVFIIEDEKK